MTGPSENLQCKNDQTLSVNGDPLDLFNQPLLLDMIFPGITHLCGGVYISFFSETPWTFFPNTENREPDKQIRTQKVKKILIGTRSLNHTVVSDYPSIKASPLAVLDSFPIPQVSNFNLLSLCNKVAAPYVCFLEHSYWTRSRRPTYYAFPCSLLSVTCGASEKTILSRNGRLCRFHASTDWYTNLISQNPKTR